MNFPKKQALDYSQTFSFVTLCPRLANVPKLS